MMLMKNSFCFKPFLGEMQGNMIIFLKSYVETLFFNSIIVFFVCIMKRINKFLNDNCSFLKRINVLKNKLISTAGCNIWKLNNSIHSIYFRFEIDYFYERIDYISFVCFLMSVFIQIKLNKQINWDIGFAKNGLYRRRILKK